MSYDADIFTSNELEFYGKRDNNIHNKNQNEQLNLSKNRWMPWQKEILSHFFGWLRTHFIMLRVYEEMISTWYFIKSWNVLIEVKIT